MDNKAKSQVNSWSIALILKLLGAKRAVQSGLGYPEFRLLRPFVWHLSKWFYLTVFTPSGVPTSNTSAPRLANKPFVTTPTI